MSFQYLGEIKAVGFNFPPRGFASCAGQILAISQNTALFSLIGTYYGGNGQTTFQLPNLGGRVPIGQGQSPGTANYTIGEMAGTETVSLGLTQLPTHSHLATTAVTPDTSTLTARTALNCVTGVPPASRLATPVGNVITLPVVASGGAVNAYAAPGTGSAATLDASSATTSLVGGVTATATTTVQNAGGSAPVPVLQPFLTINYIIATAGVFPSRN